MANTIQHKRSTTASAVPSGASLSAGEIAINTADGRLFIKKSDGTVVAIGRDASELNTGTVAAARLPAATGSTLGAIIVGTGLGVASGTVSVSYGSSGSVACVGNDARLSDTRTPTDGTVTTAKIVDANVTYAKIQNVSATDKLLGRSTAGAGVVEEIACTADARAILAANNVYACRAWVNFNGTANSSQNGTYSQSGTQVTVTTSTAHGLAANNNVYLDFTSGTGTDGNFTVTSVTSATVFVVTHTVSATTSGNCTIVKNTIRGSGNVSSVADHATGVYQINFATALEDSNYCALVSSRRMSTWLDGGDQVARDSTLGQYGFRVAHIENSVGVDSDYMMIAVFR